MGTTATVNDQQDAQNTELATTNEQPQVGTIPPGSPNLVWKQLDYGVFWVTQKRKKKDGTEIEVRKLKAITDEQEINKAKRDGTYEYGQTIGWYDAINVDGCHEVIPDEKEFVKNFNDGTKTSRVTPRMKRLFEKLVDFTQPDGTKIKVPAFNPTAGILPIGEHLKVEATRVTKTKEERMRETLRRLPGLMNKTDAELDAWYLNAKGLGLFPDIEAEIEDEDEDEEEGGEVTEAQPTAQA